VYSGSYWYPKQEFSSISKSLSEDDISYYTPAPRIFLSNYRWQKSDIWSQASYRYAILWVAFLDLSDSYFLFADLVVPKR
jgi:hypothetical protein